MTAIISHINKRWIQPANDFQKNHGAEITVSLIALAIFSSATYAGLRRFNFSARQSMIAGALCGLAALVEGYAITSIVTVSDLESKRAYR